VIDITGYNFFLMLNNGLKRHFHPPKSGFKGYLSNKYECIFLILIKISGPDPINPLSV
jgi:hypothetical protein